MRKKLVETKQIFSIGKDISVVFDLFHSLCQRANCYEQNEFPVIRRSAFIREASCSAKQQLLQLLFPLQKKLSMPLVPH